MHYRLDDIAAFVQVVETGSISKAAIQLNLSKSVVSKRVTDLEQALGVALLQRSTRGVRPTDEGTIFHARGGEIMRQLDQAAEEVATSRGELAGTLRISAPMSLGTLYLGPIFASFLSQHPRLDAMIEFNDRLVDFQEGCYDLAIRVGHLPDSSLIARQLCTSRRVVCCSPAYAERAGVPRSLDQVREHECIGYTNVQSGRAWEFAPAKEGDEPRSLTVRSRIVANNGEMIRDAAVAGLGLAVLPAFIVAKELADGRLIDAMPEARPTSVPVHAVYMKARHTSKKIQAMVKHLKTSLAGVPPWETRLSDQGERVVR